jgi:hypothetical protein
MTFYLTYILAFYLAFFLACLWVHSCPAASGACAGELAKG